MTAGSVYYMGGTGGGNGLQTTFLVVVGIASLVGYVFILRKAGYSGWLVLLGLIPLVNVVMFFVFAFSEWPIQKELASTKRAYALYAQNKNRAEAGRF